VAHENGTALPGAHQHRPPPGETNLENLEPTPKKPPMRVTINIATLNMNRFTAHANHMTGIEKWSAVNCTMSIHKIAILTLQEMHLDPTLLQNVNECFGKKLMVLNSPDPISPCALAGVVFVINKSPQKNYQHTC
jgi:hypothetical protein